MTLLDPAEIGHVGRCAAARIEICDVAVSMMVVFGDTPPPNLVALTAQVRAMRDALADAVAREQWDFVAVLGPVAQAMATDMAAIITVVARSLARPQASRDRSADAVMH